jgi:hypothetical protein
MTPTTSSLEQRVAELERENARLRGRLERTFFWINDYPEIGTHGATLEMCHIRDALGYSPARAALSKENGG